MRDIIGGAIGAATALGLHDVAEHGANLVATLVLLAVICATAVIVRMLTS